VEGKRRKVYMNMPLSAMEVDADGEPLVRYCRNKIRTSKYTILTFLPKNLYEQFRRAANVFFLILLVAQSISIFGAPSPEIAFLPLMFILTVTAIKDAIEDYRRAMIDEEVNISAVTKLENWRNVNTPKDTRPWYERFLGLNPPGKVTKGVKKLREKEASEGNRIILSRPSLVERNHGTSLHTMDSRDGRLEDIMSVDSHSYPPNSLQDPSRSSLTSLTAVAQSSVSPHIPPHQNPDWNLSSYEQSSASIGSFGVVNWGRHANGTARWERTLWKKLEVGDIVLLRDNDQIPADVVVLSTSDADGLCYVETKNLDGETNLKPRRSVKATVTISSEEDLERSSFVLDSEPPHQNLYVYHGVLRYKDAQTNEDRQEPVSINELLLRGCSIRNTAWVIGMVVFTGADTKIMLNGGETPSKQSKIEKETNFNVIVNFVVLMFMCIIAAVFNGVLDAQSGTSSEFFEVGADLSDNSVLNALVTFVSCLIAFQNIVPISLYISIEFVKTIQAFFISQDIDMYYEPLDAPCLPKTWNISDDLGQIEYIFSDKTGTLTQNVMEFQKCSIGGIPYGEGVTEAQRGAATKEGQADAFNPDELNANLATLKQDMLTKMERSFKNRYMQADQLTLVSPKLATDLTDRSSPQRNNIVAFFRALAVCHSVLSEKGEKNPYHLTYKAESPDEAALVAAARDVGFPFVGKTKDYMEIEVMGQVERYTPLQLLEFNSTRKRMSVVVRAPDGKLILYCKGADSVIYARLREDHDPALKEATAKDMEAFANNGLRTLCISYRYIEEEEYLEWSRVYDAAVNSIEDRDEAIEKANEMIEHDLIILGATALEDKLQVGVPEAIELLHRAGIKLWILTGSFPSPFLFHSPIFIVCFPLS
jgi:phospholipid-translocating ATPase